ncbi:MAG TPA: ABC transporter ATP-binding protein [Rhodospirillales bacterium]|jgi:branched-chain amino acid transport system ATP-binding protein|nr:MAG: ABC transporter ATP-binding protein [Acidithiobacillus sp.]HIM25223.1 ABC transporter ATP-binding protein [Rhodospirillales bacterium]HIM77916.1 ABC transporter ATP-binding protein [Rhodospirillales bacterium]
MAMLEVEGLTKAFGGVVANNDISFSVEEGEILGLIGPNGAGKSTVFELLTGFHSADAGRVRFQGRPILGLRPDQINRLGMGRTFQKLKPFQRMTVEENVMVGGLQHDADLGAAREQALTALYFVGLLDKRNADAGTLSTGQRKRLELARAMATGPKLLLLDEVTGGVDQRSIPALTELVGRLRSQGTTLIVIEHNMQVLMSLADRILALHLGRKIAVGTPREIQEDTLVIESYLGAAYA